MRELLNIIIIMSISAVAGAAVSIPVSIIEQNNPVAGIIDGAAAGAVIGFAARFAFTFIYIRFRKKPLPAYAAMTGTVTAGTVIGCLLIDVPIIPAGITAVTISILVSLILTSVIFNYSRKLNQRLKQKQETFKEI